MKCILIIEDEETYRTSLSFSLQRDGFEVATATNGVEGLEKALDGGWDLIILDLMLPGMSGDDVCRKIRKHSDVPVVIVSARDEVIDKVVLLEIGADDYVTKPYSYRELLARINAVLRRRSGMGVDEVEDNTITVGNIVIDVDRHTVEVDGQVIDVPLREFQLLEYLARNANRVLTRSQLMERIWGGGYFGDTKTLDVHVKRLRSRIEVEPSNPQKIVTVRGLGYKLVGD